MLGGLELSSVPFRESGAMLPDGPLTYSSEGTMLDGAIPTRRSRLPDLLVFTEVR